MTRPIASVIIPAHNEERTISRLLEALLSGPCLEIVVACNGCTDRTAEIARSYQPKVTVLDIAEPSKRIALRRGDDEASVYPRLYVDADVELTADSVRRLAEALDEPGILATAPVRVVPRDGVNIVVRWYYDVWERLPQVRTGLFGRGVIALSESGNDRVRRLPAMMSDDLVMSEAFAAHERRVVDSAQVVVRPPKTVGDLLRRRVRSVTGNAEADAGGLRSSTAKTSIGSLVELARAEPRLAPRVPVFLGISVAARVVARRAVRRGDFNTWLRDESSRA